MAENQNPIFPVPPTLAATAHITPERYDALYRRSIDDPEGFWAEIGLRLDWSKPYTRAKNTRFAPDVSIKWYEDGVLNACYNCVDRHVKTRGSQPALVWEGDDPADVRTITYSTLKDEVSRLANALKSRGIKRGDRVTIYMGMVPEAAYAMLACARIGAIHSVVFGGFSPESLRDRVIDNDSCAVLTMDESLRGGKAVPLKTNVDKALEGLDSVHTVMVLERTGGDVVMQSPRDVSWDKLVKDQSTDCPCEDMGAEDPLFILYTSGSTGKPKGVLHTTGGYLVYAALTHEWTFDYRDGEVYWCTADVGWVTGHSYIVYGPLANGATSLMFEGIPNYPDWSRYWQIVDRHKVNIFYTSPTAIRSLLKEGDEFVTRASRKSLRILGTVGEPINAQAWLWYYNVVGDARCPIADTYWQTETGGHIITPLPGATDLKPGAASKPFFGIKAALVDNDGNPLEGAAEGALVIEDSWPGQMRTVYGDHKRFEQTYFSTFKGKYFTGDGARRDEDDYYWITGRVDDVINVSGHRFGTAEIESAINRHPDVAESAVVGFPHDIKGQGIYAYVIPKHGITGNDEKAAEIIKLVRSIIGPIAIVDVVHWTNGLPKTRSGKIMRRILRKIAANELDMLGDISTLADPGVVDTLVKTRKK